MRRKKINASALAAPVRTPRLHMPAFGCLRRRRPSLVAFAEGTHELAGMTKRRAEGNKQSLVVVLKTYQLMAQAS